MSSIYEKIIRPIIFRLDAERAHELGVASMRLGLSGLFAGRKDHFPHLAVERFGLKFSNPLGLAAGFDKNAWVVNELSSLGFGFIEVGTVTLQPQSGNEKPRMFRLPLDGALLNRLGFNNDGARVVAERLVELDRRCVVGVNIGKNKDVSNDDAVENYLAAFNLVHPVADYIAINISSPNTPGLRELQKGENLEDLIKALSERNKDLQRVGSPALRRRLAANAQVGAAEEPPEGRASNPKPLLVKIAPDLSEAEIEAIVDVCLRLDVSGIIATNTTISREDLRTPNVQRLGAGGVSGRPLAKRSTAVIKQIYRLSKGRIPVVGVGGIFTAEDAFEKIAAGASLLQAYTGFVYSGPSFARDIGRGLSKMLKDRGFSSVDGAVGTAAEVSRGV